MITEQDYASDTDESDEDFRPDDLAGESAASEDEAEDGETCEEVDELNKKPVKRKSPNNKTCSRMKKSNSKDEDLSTSRRATRQINNVQSNGKIESLEKDELLSDEEDKSRTNALWADFLKDVDCPATSSKGSSSSIENGSPSDIKSQKTREKEREKDEAKISSAQKARENKLGFTDIGDVASEDVNIQQESDTSSIKENKAAIIPGAKKLPFSRIMPGVGMKRSITSSATGSPSGLGSIMNQLGKKKKISVLEKSQMDWKNFKQTEGIDEQLQTFNKGKDGYLERQDFLQRTDLRQFEIEKKMRQTTTRRPY